MSHQSSRPSFGHALRDRRHELGLSIEDVAALDGPSVSSLNRLENDKVINPHRRTMHALDRILEWEEGTTQKLFRDSKTFDESPGTERPALTIREDEIVELMTWNSLLAQHHQHTADFTASTFTDRITSITNTLLGRWIDTTIESGDPVALRFLTNIVSNQPLVPPESPDYDDQLYRRWRLGLIPDDQLNDDTVARYRQATSQSLRSLR
ncbi:helix-turn-helix domain-containing protein [Corynebacterium suicordis]|uniref:Helix-turn-helix domain-containing protein n=1 Tax=Corynebacterium suicordis DSM 45110 TaxID=1121369 RepID=A0ABR9ZLQ2_9CORY|nr:helix-turn-helix transcriptional regulator [Corynebacterium suicordis]MBF4554371.1 helix-turn-helix domain-containing protein [Corynebacterium suicordis DSM 45110]MDR6278605.1 transcriptional regulator with XRE-family HTH domain [Corynebacterium suicordis]